MNRIQKSCYPCGKEEKEKWRQYGMGGASPGIGYIVFLKLEGGLWTVELVGKDEVRRNEVETAVI